MRRGTTPTNTFTTDVNLTGATVFVDYEQRGNIILEKTGADLDITVVETQTGTTSTIELELSQEDTLSFKPGEVLIQIRAVYPDGTAIASNIIRTTAERIIKDGVIHAV